MKRYLIPVTAGVLLSAAGAALLIPSQSAQTADHLDPPSRTSPNADSTPDRAADIADVYAWNADGNLNLVLTFAGPAPTDEGATYDRDVVYRMYVSNDGDPLRTEDVIEFRFGFDGNDNPGVQASGIPGVGTIAGPVETNISRDGARLRAGLFDDPFFFDLQGFMETRDTGTIQFDSERDFFADSNLTAVVLQVPLDNFDPSGAITVWADTRRFGGQL